MGSKEGAQPKHPQQGVADAPFDAGGAGGLPFGADRATVIGEGAADGEDVTPNELGRRPVMRRLWCFRERLSCHALARRQAPRTWALAVLDEGPPRCW